MKPFVVTFSGHLSARQVSAELAPFDVLDPTTRVPLLVDVREMTGYESEARARFVEWNTAHRERVLGVAILTENLVWKVVIKAMAIASRQRGSPLWTDTFCALSFA
jgi:hypothetical protein